MSNAGVMRRPVLLLLALALATAATPTADASHVEPSGPSLDTDTKALDAALSCPDGLDGSGEGEPVLLVHGTGVTPEENWGWNYENALRDGGFDVCTVRLPDRSLVDIQVSTEYVVHAARTIHAETGERVDLVGHSQGGLQPRWAVTWWPDVRDLVDDLITLASPHHGTIVAHRAWLEILGCSEACWQMAPGSMFLGALNRDDETPGDVDYTSVYSLTDELVQPAAPEPTAALDPGENPENVANVLVQDLCPGRPVEHAGFAYDAVVYDVVLDALTQDGPFDPDRFEIGGCLDGAFEGVDPVEGVEIVLTELTGGEGFPDFHHSDEEPELRDYAKASSG